MIIDIHAHTSDYELWGCHVKTAAIPDLAREAAAHGVAKVVLVATYFPFKGTGLPNRELLRRIEGRPRFMMFGSLDAMNNLEAGVLELRELAEQEEIAGIKLYPGYQEFDFGGEEAVGIYEVARAFGLPVMFHSGQLHYCCPRDAAGNVEYKCTDRCAIEELGDLALPGRLRRAAERNPQVTFIFSHLGSPHFDELRTVMRECPNVLTDISGLFVSGGRNDTPAHRESLRHEIGKFLELPEGIRRILFGTDFPIQSYADSIGIVKALRLSPDEEQAIFCGNAARILGKRNSENVAE